jgi:hypothetical protein
MKYLTDLTAFIAPQVLIVDGEIQNIFFALSRIWAANIPIL